MAVLTALTELADGASCGCGPPKVSKISLPPYFCGIWSLDHSVASNSIAQDIPARSREQEWFDRACFWFGIPSRMLAAEKLPGIKVLHILGKIACLFPD